MGQLLLLLTIISTSLIAAFANGHVYEASRECRTIPGDISWPSDEVWTAFNTSISGRLIRNVPIASVCHGQAYDRELCEQLRSNWHFPDTHLPSPSSPMQYEFGNDSCSPFTERDAPCTIGSHVVYTVNATDAKDYRATISFARQHNIRLVIRSSGHDYLGKSTGAHALALWTLHLKSVEMLSSFESAQYSGIAMKVGAGVSGGEAQAFAHSHNRTVVVGNCASVTITGGFTQGGGHSLLSSRYGMGADQVLEFEVVTSDGTLLTATPSNEYSDLFWALTGGGGGTFAAVLSMTVRTYPETTTSIATLYVPRTLDQPPADFKNFLSTFITRLPAVVDSGATAVWALLPSAFVLIPALGPGLTQAQLDALIQPSLSLLDGLGFTYTYSSSQHPNYISAVALAPATWNVSEGHPSGRLIPRSLITESTPIDFDALIDAIVYIGDRATIGNVVYNLDLSHLASFTSSDEPTSVKPAPVSLNARLRTTLFNLVLNVPHNYSSPDPHSAWAAAYEYMDHDLLKPIKALAPDSGSYLSEASPYDEDWRQQFYGGHYEELLKVKDKYDPDEVFWVRTGVGSHRWLEEKGDGRLCRVEARRGEVEQEAREHSEL